MAEPLKDQLDVESVRAIAAAVGSEYDRFDEKSFVSAVFDDEWPNRELKQRISHIARTLQHHLPPDYGTALEILCRAARSGRIQGMSAWCLTDFVEQFGVEDPDLSLPALDQFTRIISAEFAVRPFIVRYPDRMAQQMLEWAHSDDEAIRRLASEGYRPRLPWGAGIPALKEDPAPVLPVLELLHDDPSETVRRSVANNLNDISKDHPEVVLETLAGWGDGSPEATALRQHALRTLVKRGDRAALELLGYRRDAAVNVVDMVVRPDKVSIGDHTYLEFRVVSTGNVTHPVMVDYAVVFQNRSGTGSRKVFKGKATELAPGSSLSFKRKVSLQPMSIREVYPGTHVVEAQVNGVVHATAHFEVVEYD